MKTKYTTLLAALLLLQGCAFDVKQLSEDKYEITVNDQPEKMVEENWHKQASKACNGREYSGKPTIGVLKDQTVTVPVAGIPIESNPYDSYYATGIAECK